MPTHITAVHWQVKIHKLLLKNRFINHWFYRVIHHWFFITQRTVPLHISNTFFHSWTIWRISKKQIHPLLARRARIPFNNIFCKMKTISTHLLLSQSHLRSTFEDSYALKGYFSNERPPKSPNLTPCNFWLLNYLNSQMFRDQPMFLASWKKL